MPLSNLEIQYQPTRKDITQLPQKTNKIDLFYML